ncbi:MAG: CRISPR-associated endonuclease Cas1 [Acidobacteriia bacterium]|nr:CRISPR-associated endonuclease Cas1 [Terriglobia bacterium]
MAVVYVKEQGAIIRKHGGRILVEKDEALLLEIPLRQTDSVAVFGNVQVTTQALSELLDRGIPLALYTRYGRLKGHLVPDLSKNVPLRVAQYRAALDAEASLEFAKAVVGAKLRNAGRLLADYRSNYPSDLLASAGEALRNAVERAAAAANHGELLGYEGSAAAAYFGAFAAMNRSPLPFDGRRKHPATDPINALLSLGYTLVMNEIRAAAEGAGMEPHLGFLHKVDYGRPSLALDLLEPFRSPVVDRLTLRLVNERILTAEDFATRQAGGTPGSVILLPDSFRKYLEAYEAAVSEPRERAPTGLRDAWRADVERLAAAIRDGGGFAPYCEGE